MQSNPVCLPGIIVLEVSGKHAQARDVGRLVRARCQRPGVYVCVGLRKLFTAGLHRHRYCTCICGLISALVGGWLGASGDCDCSVL